MAVTLNRILDKKNIVLGECLGSNKHYQLSAQCVLSAVTD